MDNKLFGAKNITLILAVASALFFSSASAAATDFDGPVLTGISLDKSSIDVSSGYEIVTLTINATDASDTAGYDYAYVCFRNIKPDGTNGDSTKCPQFNFSASNADSNGTSPNTTDVN